MIAGGELALATASYLLQRVVRTALLGVYVLAGSRRKGRPAGWQVLGEELLARPLALPLIMTRAPRWNTHAVIATLGPLEVRESLAVDRSAADRSAAAWTVVVVPFPLRPAVATLGPNGPEQGGWAFTQLPAGRYSLALRYYEWTDRAELPAVRVDGRDAVPALAIDPAINRFYDRLAERSNFFFRAIGWYVLSMLKWRHRLPAGFVERELLPAGNPETQFRYGPLAAGERLRLRLDPAALYAFRVYLTVYGRDSFPLSWQPIAEEETVLPAARVAGFYLVRILQREPSQAPLPAAALAIDVL